MLYRLHNNIFIVGLLTLGFLVVLSSGRALCAITPVTVFAFITQVALLLWFAHDDINSYSEKDLFLVVLIYSSLIAGLIIGVSNLFLGEDFLWEDPDGVFYYEEGMRSADLGLADNVIRIITRFGFDDWGALILSAFMMYVIPSSFFMNALHILTGAISAVLLFRIGKHFMSEKYAFMAGLAYGTSSYLIMFHCTYLKESFFTFLVICAMYNFYQAVVDKKNGSLILAFFFLFIMVFYRPAVVAFLLVGFVGYYAITQHGSALSLFLYGMIAVGLVASMAFLQSQMDHYTEGGNTDELLVENGSANYSGGFNYFVGWFASLFGPFPTLFPNDSQGPRNINFYGAGLIYKLFLVIPLWTGAFFSVKRLNVMMIPILGFTVVEMAASAYVMASFELRKVMLHMPFIYLLAFYGLYCLEKYKIGDTYKHLSEIAGHILVIGILLLWNVIKVKG